MAGSLTYPPKLRVGIVGTGFVARRVHIPGWAAMPGVEIAALCNPDVASLEEAGRFAPQAQRFPDLGVFLASGLDAVSVCTTNAAHYPVALAALEAGLHVLCEKPLGISAAEVRALGAAADARGLILMAQHPLRFDDPARAARACIEAGRVGAVHHAQVRALRRDRAPTLPGFTDRALSGGGAVLDLGVHALDMALYLMDFPAAVRVTGSVRTNFAHGDRIPGHWGEWNRDRFNVEDFGTGFVHFANGATLGLECAWLGHSAEEGHSVELFGEKSNLCWPSGEWISQGAALHREVLQEGESTSTPAVDSNVRAITAFYRAITQGSPSPVPWKQALESIRIIEAMYASAREGREIRI